MKKNIMFVKDADQSIMVQEALFKAGFCWSSQIERREKPRPLHTEYPFIRTHEYGYMTLEGCRPFTTAAEYIASGHVAVEASDVIENPFQLFGAKQPEKMIEVKGKQYTESRLAELCEAAEKLEGES